MGQIQEKTTNRLYGSSVYLCGPMDRCPNGGVQWRQSITPFLESLGIFVLDPCDKPTTEEYYREDPDTRKKLEIAKKEKRWGDVHELMSHVRAIDLRMVDISSFLIVNFDLNAKPIGTLEEISLANHQRKPILVHAVDGISELPTWLFAQLKYELFFDTWDNLKNYLLHINQDSNIDTLNHRWKFIDWDKLSQGTKL